MDYAHPLIASLLLLLQLAYHHGVVLVRCPGCTNLHLVADHLGYFEDGSVDVEAILAQRGEAVRTGQLPSAASVGYDIDGGGSGDKFVCEFSAQDIAVLSSLTKSVSLKTGKEVHQTVRTVDAIADSAEVPDRTARLEKEGGSDSGPAAAPPHLR